MTQGNHIEDASAFFALFTRSEWGSAHVRTAGVEIFVARERGGRNPMTAPAIDTPAIAGSASGGELRAPHVGTVAELAPVGAGLAAGECYARLDLLGDLIELTVAEGVTIARHLLPIGALAEFDQPLVAVR